tara:strand:+ start:842 stop:1096 length:255 start_codon:yes stop_codon:yes gene_type:complete
VEPLEEEEEETESVIVLPTDYEKPKSQYITAKVLDYAKDCNTIISKGSVVVIERRMLHAIEIKGETYYLVLENYIFGRLDNYEA